MKHEGGKTLPFVFFLPVEAGGRFSAFLWYPTIDVVGAV